MRSRYARNTVKLPRPEFYVFYNGENSTETEYIQKLSDAYIDTDNNSNVSLELTVKVININTASGSNLLKKCKILSEYSKFVETVRAFQKKGIDDYMKKAITYCIENHILEEYLSRKGSDVMNFLCAEYDYEMDIQVQREEAYDNGFEDGLFHFIDYLSSNKNSKQNIIIQLQNFYSLSPSEAENTYTKYLNKKDIKK